MFAARAPDVRMLDILERFSFPAETRVLDLGCAGGRNTIALAERGFDVYAVDSARAMVERTRGRISAVLGSAEAERRVRQRRMEDLREFADESFRLVVALGVFQAASTLALWHSAVAEARRVIGCGDLLLVSHFTPASDLTGDGLRTVPGEPTVYEGLPGGGRAVLLETAELDEAFARHGFVPEFRSRRVEVELAVGRRVVTNALYRRDR
ncbi:hypothetical protein BH20GEM2_BH20GEM2_11240 [soil metagenome]